MRDGGSGGNRLVTYELGILVLCTAHALSDSARNGPLAALRSNEGIGLRHNWIRWYIRFHALRHPINMGAAEVKVFLSYLINERSVSVSTHKQALCSLLFLYKHVLETDFHRSTV